MFLSLRDLLSQAGDLLNRAPGTAPPIDFTDTGDTLLCRLQLPGIDPQSVQVQVSETSLAIAGQASMEEKTESLNFFRYQAAMGSIYREVGLPARVDPHRSTTDWQSDGSLVITLPKR